MKNKNQIKEKKMKYKNLTEAILISFLVIFTVNMSVVGQEALPMLPYFVYHIDDTNAPCGGSPCETILISFSDEVKMTFGARNLTGQNIFWDSTIGFSDDTWTQYMLGFYQLWIEGIIWGNSTCSTSSTGWTKMKSFQISEVNESYSGIYPQLNFNITLIISHSIIGKQNETLTKLSIYLDLTNFIPYWVNSDVFTPFSTDQKIFIGIIYRTMVIASRDMYGLDKDWIVPDFYNNSSVIWTIEGTQCTSMHFERDAKRMENEAWFEENATSSVYPRGPEEPIVWFNHIVPNCSVNTTWLLIDPIINVNGDFVWWSEKTNIEMIPIVFLVIISCSVIGIVVVTLVIRNKKQTGKKPHGVTKEKKPQGSHGATFPGL